MLLFSPNDEHLFCCLWWFVYVTYNNVNNYAGEWIDRKIVKNKLFLDASCGCCLFSLECYWPLSLNQAYCNQSPLPPMIHNPRLRTILWEKSLKMHINLKDKSVDVQLSLNVSTLSDIITTKCGLSVNSIEAASWFWMKTKQNLSKKKINIPMQRKIPFRQTWERKF